MQTYDSRIEDLKVKHSDQVEADQLLVQLRSTKLENDADIVEGELRTTQEAIFSKQRDLQDDSKLRVEERNRLRGEMAELNQKLLSLKKTLALCKINQAELAIKSPINGQVVTWDLQNRLPNARPVQRGQILMRVADPSGPWQLELHMPENRMGHVAEAQKEIYDKSREKLRGLIKEQLRAKSPDAPEDEINAAVEKELAKVPDDQLRDKQIALLNEQFHGQLSGIVKDVPDGELKDKLAGVLKEESYDQARAKLKEAMPEVTDADLSARLAALPSEEPEDDQLQVSYILATEPGKTRYGTVKEIQHSAEVRGDEGNTVLIKVAINKEELPDLRPGATVTAKVYCGRRPLGYVLLDDLISFIQTRIIFRYF